MKKIILLFILFSFINITGCLNKKDEPIIYGEIDFSAEEVEIKKPKNSQQSKDLIGNNFLNILQGGLFAEDTENYFYVIEYDNEFYLIKENKSTEEKLKIYKGNIRNLFVTDGWIYGIIHNMNSEQIIVMDIEGNNIITSSKFKKEVRSMFSDGEKIYFTLDASNIIQSQIKTGIYSCNMDLSEINTEKLAYNTLSQIDLITKRDGYIFFNEENYAKDEGLFIYSTMNKNNFLTYLLEEFNIVDLDAFNKNFLINTMNYQNNIIYISASLGDDYYFIKYNSYTNEYIQEKSEKIVSIYCFEKDIILYDGNYYIRKEL